MTVATNDDAQQSGAQEPPTKLPVALTGPLAGLDEAYRMAQALAQSGLMPASLRNKPNDVLVTILYGHELGLGPMQATQVIHVINGRPNLAGQLWLSLARKAGHRVEITGDDKSATCTITRGDSGETHTESFTMDDAKRAKLDQKDVWKAWPKRMLKWRAVSHCATMACPEVAIGFAIREAVDEEQSAKPTLAEVAQQRVDTTTGEVHDAEVVDDDAVRREVEQLQEQATQPDDADFAAMNAEADQDAALFAGGA